MAFPVGWERKVALTVESDDIDGDLTDWTLVVGELLSSVLTSVDGPLDADGAGPMLSDGGDVRFSSDAAGVTQLAVDMRRVTLDNTPANALFQCAVKIPSVSSSTDTTVYMWWKKAGESQPTPASTFGQYNAYDGDHAAVYSLFEDPSGSAPQIHDRTVGQNHGTSAGTMTSGDLVDGAIGKDSAIDFDGTDDLINCGDDAALRVETAAFQVDALAFIGVIGSGEGIISKRKFSGPAVGWVVIIAAEVRWQLPFGTSIHTTAKAVGSWSLFGGHQESDGGNQRVELNGVQFNGDTETGDQGDTTGQDLLIGLNGNGSTNWFNDKIQECRVYSDERNNAWSVAVFDNLSAKSGFLTLGTITEIEVPVVQTAQMLGSNF